MKALMYWWKRLEMANHKLDAYLAQCRGDKVEAAYCRQKVTEIKWSL